MLYVLVLTVALVAGFNAVLAAPYTTSIRRQTPSALSAAQIAAFKPYTFFASSAYCNPSLTLSWTCGANCAANPGFQPIASGGDGTVVQFWFVGYDPVHNTIVVAHQGTVPANILPLVTDLNIAFTGLSFPGIDPGVQVHEGFANAQKSTSAAILNAVTTGLAQHNIASVTTVGHSLGGAISLLDAVFLHTQIPNIQIAFYGYGLPRVGNQNFATYVDTNIQSFTRITNRDDPVPILPGIFLGFHHPSGEAHIEDDLTWDFCPGEDNGSKLCSTGDTPTIFDTVLSEHHGPYDGVTMGC